jgi:hypothetical protein
MVAQAGIGTKKEFSATCRAMLCLRGNIVLLKIPVDSRSILWFL